jgi:hypothetical protein
MIKSTKKCPTIKLKLSSSKDKILVTTRTNITLLKKEIPLLNNNKQIVLGDFPNIIARKRNASYTEKQLLSVRKPVTRADILGKTSQRELMSQSYINVASKLLRSKATGVKQTQSVCNSGLRTKNSSYDFSTKKSDVTSDMGATSCSRKTSMGISSGNSMKIKDLPSTPHKPTTIDSPEELHFIQVKFFQDNKNLASKFDY